MDIHKLLMPRKDWKSKSIQYLRKFLVNRRQWKSFASPKTEQISYSPKNRENLLKGERIKLIDL